MRTKGLNFVTKEEVQRIKEDLSAKCLQNLKESEQEPTDKEANEYSPSTKQARLDWLDDVIGDANQPEAMITKEEKVMREVDTYWEEKQYPGVDPLVWWKVKAKDFPNVSKVARHILAVPASSVSSERIFSLAGNLVDHNQSQLAPDTVNVLIFFDKNMKN